MNPTKHEIQLQRVFNEHLPALKAYAESWDGVRPADVEEVMNEVMRRFFKQAEKGLIDNPRGMLVTITKRELVRSLSDRLTGSDAMDLFGAIPFEGDEGLASDAFENAHTQDPLDLMVAAENRASERSLAEAELKTLVPNDDHRLMYLLAADDMAYETIAEKFETTPKAVADVVHRVRTRIKGYVGGQ